MTYVISDIHGCLDRLKKLLKQIDFQPSDTLCILGDIFDRGPDPIETCRFLMGMDNVVLLMGNHELMGVPILLRLNQEINDEFLDSLTVDDLMDLQVWLSNGAETTIGQFTLLDPEERQAVLDWLLEAELYKELEINGRKWTLVHAGLGNYEAGKPLDAYDPEELLWHRTGPVTLEDNHFLVVGHTPVQLIRPDRQPQVYRENSQVHIDCGCVFGGKLAALRLDDGEIFYA